MAAWAAPTGLSTVPVVDVLEALESGALEFAHVAQGAPIELDVGEVFEQEVVRLVVGTLELLTG